MTSDTLSRSTRHDAKVNVLNSHLIKCWLIKCLGRADRIRWIHDDDVVSIIPLFDVKMRPSHRPIKVKPIRACIVIPNHNKFVTIIGLNSRSEASGSCDAGSTTTVLQSGVRVRAHQPQKSVSPTSWETNIPYPSPQMSLDDVLKNTRVWYGMWS